MSLRLVHVAAAQREAHGHLRNISVRNERDSHSVGQRVSLVRRNGECFRRAAWRGRLFLRGARAASCAVAVEKRKPSLNDCAYQEQASFVFRAHRSLRAALLCRSTLLDSSSCSRGILLGFAPAAAGSAAAAFGSTTSTVRFSGRKYSAAVFCNSSGVTFSYLRHQLIHPPGSSSNSAKLASISISPNPPCVADRVVQIRARFHQRAIEHLLIHRLRAQRLDRRRRSPKQCRPAWSTDRTIMSAINSIGP